LPDRDKPLLNELSGYRVVESPYRTEEGKNVSLIPEGAQKLSVPEFNRLALEGLRALGYPEDFVNEAALEVAGLDGLISAFQGNMDSVVNQLIVDPCNDQAGPVRLAWRRL
ncbi:hypothetical protein LJB63_21545, partial [[Eubacterium] rectale]|nr:hypothetical protein [Agathobacter rectalis]